jgi:hypothetical protein
MSLKNYKLGELIKIFDERNSYNIKKFYGININKEFIPTFANTSPSHPYEWADDIYLDIFYCIIVVVGLNRCSPVAIAYS